MVTQVQWWSKYSHLISPDFEAFLRYESEAAKGYYFAQYLLPGIIHTEEYARHIYEQVLPFHISRKIVQEKIELRMARQWQVMERLTRPAITIVLDESVLHRSFGNRPLLRRQLHSLMHIMTQPDITVRVLSFDCPVNPIIVQCFFF